jgi:ankyrin repeat protein
MATLAPRPAEPDDRRPTTARPISSPPPISSTHPARPQTEVILMPSPCGHMLFESCRSANIDKAKIAIAKGADLEGLDPKTKSTPLTIVRMQRIRAIDAETDEDPDAPKFNRAREISALAPAGAYTELEQLILDRIFLKAVESGDDEKSGWAIYEGANRDVLSEQLNLNQILLQAAENGDVDKIKWALNEGANKNAIDPEFRASAVILAASGGHFEAVQVLREFGADMEKRDLYDMNVWNWLSLNTPRH